MTDKRTTFSRLKEMLRHYSRAGNRRDISFYALENLIIRHIGSSPRTIRESMAIMTRMKLVEDIGSARFRIVRFNLE